MCQSDGPGGISHHNYNLIWLDALSSQAQYIAQCSKGCHLHASDVILALVTAIGLTSLLKYGVSPKVSVSFGINKHDLLCHSGGRLLNVSVQ